MKLNLIEPRYSYSVWFAHGTVLKAWLSQIKAFASFAVLGEAAATLIAANIASNDSDFDGWGGGEQATLCHYNNRHYERSLIWVTCLFMVFQLHQLPFAFAANAKCSPV